MPSPLALDSQQRAAVDHAAGPLWLLGGPGTGKTTALAERFVRLALAPGRSPDRILWLVPTRAQKTALADALTRRLVVDEGLGALIEVPVYTWHGFAHHLVTRYHRRLAYPEPPVLLTSPEQWADVYEALAAEPEVNWPRYHRLLRSPGFADEVVDFGIRVEQRLLEASDLEALCADRPDYAEVVAFYLRHRDRLRGAGRVDYPTLLRDAAELIARHDDVRAGLHRRFPDVLVDDGQELAPVQQRLLVFLTGFEDDGGRDRSLVVAADPDSAIETFRGADPDWLGRAGGQFAGAAAVTLGTSYRLGPDLGARAGEVIAANGPSPHRPAAFAGSTELEVRRFPSLASEAQAAARALRSAQVRDRIPYDDMAVLVTAPAAILPPLERALEDVEVPYWVAVPDRPLEREPAVRAVRDLLLWAFDDDAASLDALLRSRLSGIGEAQARELERRAGLAGATVAALVADRPGDLPEPLAARIEELVRLRKLAASHRRSRADEAFWALWSEASHYRDLERAARADPDGRAARDVEAMAAFGRALGRFVERRRGRGTLQDYLDALGRADFGSDPWLPPQRARGGVEILSFHAAKGRQWSFVVVIGCVEGVIPRGRRARGLFDPYFLDELGPVERARRNEAEDRRVFYVAVTRAARRCLVTASPGPTRRGRPSRFVRELAGEVPEVERVAASAPLTLAEAASVHRRTVADTASSATARLAALDALAGIRRADPGCSAADPSEWWWRWDWTEGAVPLRDQSGRDRDDPAEGGIRTSYSRIGKYDNCGLAYLMSVVLGLDPDTSHNMAFGTWIHQIFEDCEKEPSPEQAAAGRRRLTSIDMVRARYEELFDDSVFPNRAVANQFRRDGIVMLERYCNLMRPGTAVVAEHRFCVDFRGHRVTGRIDRVDKAGRGIRISDYKTSRTPIGWDEAKDSLQLAIYYLAARSDPDLSRHGPPLCTQLVYPAQLYKGDVAKRVQTPEESETVLERLPGLLAGVLAEDFSPSPVADCTWCKFKPLCPLWPEGKELSP